MNCPNCNANIPDKRIAKYLASKGGLKAKGRSGRKKIEPQTARQRANQKYYETVIRLKPRKIAENDRFIEQTFDADFEDGA